MRLSNTTLHLLAKGGDEQAARLCRTWASLERFQHDDKYGPVVEAWYTPTSGIQVALVRPDER